MTTTATKRKNGTKKKPSTPGLPKVLELIPATGNFEWIKHELDDEGYSILTLSVRPTLGRTGEPLEIRLQVLQNRKPPI